MITLRNKVESLFPTATFRRICGLRSSLIDKDGNAALTFNHASTYSIVISEEELDETAINTDASDESNPSNDNGTDTKDTASATQMTIEATEETSRNMLALFTNL